jgi:hypothetical protein
MHMKSGSLRVVAGQAVKKGDIVGIMGTTGDSTGIHLHFDIREDSTYQNNGKAVDPEPYLYGAKTMRPGASAPAQSAPATFAVGNKAKIKASAEKYTGGQTIPARIKGVEYTVMQINGDRVLLKEIMSWVYAIDLVKA